MIFQKVLGVPTVHPIEAATAASHVPESRWTPSCSLRLWPWWMSCWCLLSSPGGHQDIRSCSFLVATSASHRSHWRDPVGEKERGLGPDKDEALLLGAKWGVNKGSESQGEMFS